MGLHERMCSASKVCLHALSSLPAPCAATLQHVRRYEQLTSGSELVESMIKDVLPELLNAEVWGGAAWCHSL